MEDHKKSARKYWWIMVLLPLGLAVGVVTSLVQHLRKDAEEKEAAEHRVSVELRGAELEDAINKAMRFGKRGLASEDERHQLTIATKFIRGSLSPENTGFHIKHNRGTAHDGVLWRSIWVEVKGENERDVVAVIVPLDGDPGAGNAARLAIPMSVAQAVAAEKFRETLRFVFVPESKPLAEQVDLYKKQCLEKKETLVAAIVLREMPEVKVEDDFAWIAPQGDSALVAWLESGTRPENATDLSTEWTHPVLRTRGVEDTTVKTVKNCLEAAVELRDELVRMLGEN